MADRFVYVAEMIKMLRTQGYGFVDLLPGGRGDGKSVQKSKPLRSTHQKLFAVTSSCFKDSAYSALSSSARL
jgi:hypothetical protein